jgi:hypothetical protein
VIRAASGAQLRATTCPSVDQAKLCERIHFRGRLLLQALHRFVDIPVLLLIFLGASMLAMFAICCRTSRNSGA